jgi:hypothetical protein
MTEGVHETVCNGKAKACRIRYNIPTVPSQVSSKVNTKRRKEKAED